MNEDGHSRNAEGTDSRECISGMEWSGMEWQSPQTEWQVVTVLKGGGDQEKTVMSFEQVD